MFERQAELQRREITLLDLALTTLVLLGAYLVRSLAIGHWGSLIPYLALLPVIAPLWVFLLTFFGAYRSPHEATTTDLIGATAKAVATGVAVLLSLLFVLKAQYVSRIIVGVFALVNFLALSGVRVLWVWRLRAALRRGVGVRRVLIVGSGNRARKLARSFVDQAERGIHIVGHLDPDPLTVGVRMPGSHVMGTVDDITLVLKNHVIDEVILAIPRSMMTQVEKVVRACEEEGVKVRLMVDLFEVTMARVSLDAFDGVPMLTLEPVAQEEWQLLIKRMADVAISLVLLLLLLPVMGVVAVAIRLDSRGPALFTQERVGQNKRRFRVYKFRTMVEGGEKLQASLENLNEADGPVFKIAADPRITRIGRILRRTSLDELPQLFNVLKGEMSLVGPRPLPLRDVNRFDRGIQRRRFSVKPGVTGLWQVSGRSQLSFTQWLELDLWYIDNWSLWLDARILVRTIPAVVTADGAR